jgi:uncharacterized coiled-coil DUF342 family protein
MTQNAAHDGAKELAAHADAARDTIDQVRELLFGHEKRRTDQTLTELRAEMVREIATLRGEMQEHVDSLTARLIDLDKTSEQRRLESIAEIGKAISQLGAAVQNMGADKPRR